MPADHLALDLVAIFEHLAVEGRQRMVAEVIGMAIEEGIALPGFVLAMLGVHGVGIIGVDTAVASG
jgi:hypothetical protein